MGAVRGAARTQRAGPPGRLRARTATRCTTWSTTCRSLPGDLDLRRPDLRPPDVAVPARARDAGALGADAGPGARRWSRCRPSPVTGPSGSHPPRTCRYWTREPPPSPPAAPPPGRGSPPSSSPSRGAGRPAWSGARPGRHRIAAPVEGRGYGHGRGMSQWGAYGAADAGAGLDPDPRLLLPGHHPRRHGHRAGPGAAVRRHRRRRARAGDRRSRAAQRRQTARARRPARTTTPGGWCAPARARSRSLQRLDAGVWTTVTPPVPISGDTGFVVPGGDRAAGAPVRRRHRLPRRGAGGARGHRPACAASRCSTWRPTCAASSRRRCRPRGTSRRCGRSRSRPARTRPGCGPRDAANGVGPVRHHRLPGLQGRRDVRGRRHAADVVRAPAHRRRDRGDRGHRADLDLRRHDVGGLHRVQRRQRRRHRRRLGAVPGGQGRPLRRTDPVSTAHAWTTVGARRDDRAGLPHDRQLPRRSPCSRATAWGSGAAGPPRCGSAAARGRSPSPATPCGRRSACGRRGSAPALAPHPRDLSRDGYADVLAVTTAGRLTLHPGWTPGGAANLGAAIELGRGWGAMRLLTQVGDWDGDGVGRRGGQRRRRPAAALPRRGRRRRHHPRRPRRDRQGLDRRSPRWSASATWTATAPSTWWPGARRPDPVALPRRRPRRGSPVRCTSAAAGAGSTSSPRSATSTATAAPTLVRPRPRTGALLLYRGRPGGTLAAGTDRSAPAWGSVRGAVGPGRPRRGRRRATSSRSTPPARCAATPGPASGLGRPDPRSPAGPGRDSSADRPTARRG